MDDEDDLVWSEEDEVKEPGPMGDGTRRDAVILPVVIVRDPRRTASSSTKRSNDDGDGVDHAAPCKVVRLNNGSAVASNEKVVSPEQEAPRRSTIVEPAIEELELSDTLEKHSLPDSVMKFFIELLSWDPKNFKKEIKRICESRLLDIAKVNQFEANMLQVAFIPHLLLDMYNQISSEWPPRKIGCDYCIFSKDEPRLGESLVSIWCTRARDVSERPQINIGDLVLLTIVQDDEIDKQRTRMLDYKHVCFAYIDSVKSYVHNRCSIQETNLLKLSNKSPDTVLFDDVCVRLLAAPVLFETNKFVFHIQPLFIINSILTQVVSLLKIDTDLLFQFVRADKFSVPPSGYEISSSPNNFTVPQLDTIQRVTDIALPTCSEEDIQLLVTIGDTYLIKQTFTESLFQLLDNEKFHEHQFTVVATDYLEATWITDTLKKYQKELKVYCGGHRDSEKWMRWHRNSYCQHYIDTSQKQIANAGAALNINTILLEQDKETMGEQEFIKSTRECDKLKIELTELNKRLVFFEATKAFMDGNPIESDVKPCEAALQADKFEDKAKLHNMQRASVIVATFEDLWNDHDLYGYLKEKDSADAQVKRKKLSECALIVAPISCSKIYTLPKLGFRKLVVMDDLVDQHSNSHPLASKLYLEKSFAYWISAMTKKPSCLIQL